MVISLPGDDNGSRLYLNPNYIVSITVMPNQIVNRDLKAVSIQMIDGNYYGVNLTEAKVQEVIRD